MRIEHKTCKIKPKKYEKVQNNTKNDKLKRKVIGCFIKCIYVYDRIKIE